MTTQRNMLMLVLLVTVVVASAQNITKVLDGEPQFSSLNKLLSETGVADEINIRKSITVLAPDNSVLDPIVSNLRGKTSPEQLGDIVRYHVLLQYFDIPELRQIVDKGTTQVTTLYQATGRPAGILGFVNITKTKGGSLDVTTPAGEHPSSSTIVKSIKQIPYNMSIFQLSAVLMPVGVLTEATPPTPVPVPSPVTAPESAPALSPALSPVPPAPAPTPAPTAAPVPTPSPTAVPVSSPPVPVSSPPAPPSEVPSSVPESPSPPPKNSAFQSVVSPLLINVSLLVGLALPFLLQL